MVGELLHKSLEEVGDLPREELLYWWAWTQERPEEAEGGGES